MGKYIVSRFHVTIIINNIINMGKYIVSRFHVTKNNFKYDKMIQTWEI